MKLLNRASLFLLFLAAVGWAAEPVKVWQNTRLSGSPATPPPLGSVRAYPELAVQRPVVRRDALPLMVHADAVGTTLYYGKGAGSEPTASAVIADLVDITRLHTADPLNRVPHLAFQPDAMSNLPILPMAQVVTSYYLRLRVADQAGVLAKVTGILANADISIDAVLQREAGEGESHTDLIILTHDCVEAKMNQAIAEMQQLSTVLAPITRIRKEELN